MSDHNFYLHDSVHILRSNGTTEHAEAVEWAVSRLAQLESVLAEAKRECIMTPFCAAKIDATDAAQENGK